jgi:hypothetical protein
MTKGIIGYWFAASDELPHGDGRKVVIGETLVVEPPIVPCQRGLHACVDPFDALQYASGAILYKVRLSGKIVEDGDKHAASERTAVVKRDATQILRSFARKMALSVIHLWNAPAIVREYLETGNERKRDAARDAAGDAAGAAAWNAAGAAAKAAAGDAAWAAARHAARAVAGHAARAVARDAAWDDARKLFKEMVEALFEGDEQ